MDEYIKSKIIFEISQIDTLMDKSSILAQKCKIKEPDFIEINAAASTLHSYYNGLENIFLLISKNIDKSSLQSQKWHRELLESMFNSTDVRAAVIDRDLYEQLFDYMSFRHVFRHSYSYALDWGRLNPLFSSMYENWVKVKNCLEIFTEEREEK